ncbi:dipeptidyl aminopeptidase [Paenibacillus sp. ACRRX]|uniref:dipeptidyl aminopeptidase n=1 Tax=Paenibacillus sp. ACRRX TaxID=2918206 RepID=UPI001EF4695B|nr:dipeptidyl aminopeptidase [Paenibacillus sp. ACRRX]MCG7408627.1 dipeptidyl aminopeptidase [Paenibacillus sp. ACRRX]
MKECIIHFDLQARNGEIEKLRGLVMIEEGKKPTAAQILDMLDMMGYKASIEDEDHYVFAPAGGSSTFDKIVVKKMDAGEESFTPDPFLKAIAESMMEKNRRFL